MARTIVSVAAAPGWAARFVDDEGDKVVTLLAWALVEDGASRTGETVAPELVVRASTATV